MTNTIAMERKRLGMTQADLAKEFGKDRSTIARWEANPSMMTGVHLHKLSDMFGCTTDYILGRTDDRVPVLHLANKEEVSHA